MPNGSLACGDLPWALDHPAGADDEQALEPEAAEPVHLALEPFAVGAGAATDQIIDALALDGEHRDGKLKEVSPKAINRAIFTH